MGDFEIHEGEEEKGHFDEFYLDQRPVPNATAVLVLGIISIVGCFCYGIIGLICGIIALILSVEGNRSLRATPNRFTQSSISTFRAGRICAIVGVSLSSLWFLWFLFAILGVISNGFNLMNL